MLIDEIIEKSKKGKVMVFFDMDGCICEYKSGESKDIKENKPGIYFNKRPIYSVIDRLKELSQIDNVELGILSNCYFKEQKEEKLKWLAIYVPFIKKENIHVIILNDEIFDSNTKNDLKGNRLKEIVTDNQVEVYLLEDNHSIISATRKVNPRVHPEHISTIIY